MQEAANMYLALGSQIERLEPHLQLIRPEIGDPSRAPVWQNVVSDPAFVRPTGTETLGHSFGSVRN
jgi:hypothetical protein